MRYHFREVDSIDSSLLGHTLIPRAATSQEDTGKFFVVARKRKTSALRVIFGLGKLEVSGNPRFYEAVLEPPNWWKAQHPR